MQQILGKGKTRKNITPKDTPQETSYQPHITERPGVGSLSDNWRKKVPPPHLIPTSDMALFVAKMPAKREDKQAFQVFDDARAQKKAALDKQ